MNKGPLRIPAMRFWMGFVAMDGASDFLERSGSKISTTQLVTHSL